MENNETYVSLEIAKKLAKCGFNWPVRGFYDWYGKLCIGCPTPVNYNMDYHDADPMYSAPTVEVANKWLRDEKRYNIMIDCHGTKNWLPTVQHMVGPSDYLVRPFEGNDYIHTGYESYDEAVEAAIDKALTVVCNTMEVSEE